jgi:tetratricopeptide (TPR) repeat protein
MTIINIGIALAQSKKPDEAMQYFDRAVNLDPNQAMAYNAKALLYLKTDRQSEALNNLDKALELEPGNTESLKLRSQILENK